MELPDSDEPELGLPVERGLDSVVPELLPVVPLVPIPPRCFACFFT
jgi:hypothetical protein